MEMPDPTRAMRIPLSAGPISPPRWKIDALTLMALRSLEVPTISVTKADRAGPSIAVATPSTNAARRTCQTSTAPVIVIAARVAQTTTDVVAVEMRMTRFGYRSAMTPPHAPNTRIGPNCRAMVIPTSMTLPVSSSTSQSTAIRCIHAAVFDTICDDTYRR